MSDSDTAPLLGKLRPKSTIGKGVSFFVAAATIASLVGALFFARGGSKLLTRADNSLGVEASQPFVNAAGVQQGQCDLVTVNSKALPSFLRRASPAIQHTQSESILFFNVPAARVTGARAMVSGFLVISLFSGTMTRHPGGSICSRAAASVAAHPRRDVTSKDCVFIFLHRSMGRQRAEDAWVYVTLNSNLIQTLRLASPCM